MTLADVLARAIALREGHDWAEEVELTEYVYGPGADPLDSTDEWYDTPREMAAAILATPEGQALQALVEAALAWADYWLHRAS